MTSRDNDDDGSPSPATDPLEEFGVQDENEPTIIRIDREEVRSVGAPRSERTPSAPAAFGATSRAGSTPSSPGADAPAEDAASQRTPTAAPASEDRGADEVDDGPQSPAGPGVPEPTPRTAADWAAAEPNEADVEPGGAVTEPPREGPGAVPATPPEPLLRTAHPTAVTPTAGDGGADSPASAPDSHEAAEESAEEAAEEAPPEPAAAAEPAPAEPAPVEPAPTVPLSPRRVVTSEEDAQPTGVLPTTDAQPTEVIPAAAPRRAAPFAPSAAGVSDADSAADAAELERRAAWLAEREARDRALGRRRPAPEPEVAPQPPSTRLDRTTDRPAGAFGLFALRLVVAAIMGIRGAQQLLDMPTTIQTFSATALPYPEIAAWVTACASVLIAVALVFGLLVRVAGVGTVAIAAGALTFVYWWRSPFESGVAGFHGELELLLAGVGLLLLLIGGGSWGIDAAVRKSRLQRRRAKWDLQQI